MPTIRLWDSNTPLLYKGTGGPFIAVGDCCCHYGCDDVAADNYDENANYKRDIECCYTTHLANRVRVGIVASGWFKCPGENYGVGEPDRQVDFSITFPSTDYVIGATFVRCDLYSDDTTIASSGTTGDDSFVSLSGVTDSGSCSGGGVCSDSVSLNPDQLRLDWNGTVGAEWLLRVGDPIAIGISGDCFLDCGDLEESPCDAGILSGGFLVEDVPIATEDLIGVHTFNFDSDNDDFNAFDPATRYVECAVTIEFFYVP